jgi:hypothetical protein
MRHASALTVSLPDQLEPTVRAIATPFFDFAATRDISDGKAPRTPLRDLARLADHDRHFMRLHVTAAAP